jgi:hypothetical protein
MRSPPLHGRLGAATVADAGAGGLRAAGCAEGLMIAHCFSIEDMVGAAGARRAGERDRRERVMAGRKAMEVARVRITDAGRRAQRSIAVSAGDVLRPAA